MRGWKREAIPTRYIGKYDEDEQKDFPTANLSEVPNPEARLARRMSRPGATAKPSGRSTWAYAAVPPSRYLPTR